jgi:CubicO group peptidase (beta-lactamase class C family)
MQHAFLEPDPSGVFVASSYAYLSARDWARLGQLMLNGGVLNNQRIISRDWVEQAREPNTSSNDRRYGYQFWLNDGGAQPRWPELPSDSFAMLGNRMQVVMVVPSHHAVLVRLGWSPGAYPTAERFAELLRAM